MGDSVLIVATKNFGLDFTGATFATQMLLERWVRSFSRVAVVAMAAGEVSEKVAQAGNVEVRVRGSAPAFCAAVRALCRENPGAVLYSDDHMLGVLGPTGVRTVHTYHGNWPDIRRSSAEMLLKSLVFMPLYERAFRACDCAVTVSRYMQGYVARTAPRVELIRNGMGRRRAEDAGGGPRENILMVGTVDRRKYAEAVPVVRRLASMAPGCEVHVYGNVACQSVARALAAQPNVRLMGFSGDIRFSSYRALLCCSRFENLSIAVCEAIDARTPVAAYAVGGIPEVVNERNGVLVEPFRADELACAAAGIACGGIALPGDRSPLDEFDWDRSAARYLEVFASVEGRRR